MTAARPGPQTHPQIHPSTHPPSQPADAPLVLISPNPGWQLRLPGCRSSSLCHFLIRIIFFAAVTRELIREPAGAGAQVPPDTTTEALLITGCEQKSGRQSAKKKGATSKTEEQEVRRESGWSCGRCRPPSRGRGQAFLAPWRRPGQTSPAFRQHIGSIETANVAVVAVELSSSLGKQPFSGLK